MKDKKISYITKIYYSNPKIQEAIFSFSKERETIPSYMMEAFGKRPDTLQYPSDIMNLVNKGATSFHCSEEIWNNPLELNSDMSQSELSTIRKTWDLLIDIDSPYLDYSKIAAKLIIEELERHGVKSYSLKFSGSKGFHIIVPAKAFPKEFRDQKTSEMFPEWPRAISEYLMYKIKSNYNKEVTKLEINFKALEERTKLSKEDVTETICPNCGSPAKKGSKVSLECDRCDNIQIRLNHKITKRKLKCINETCPGNYQIKEEKELFTCENCGYSSLDKTGFKTRNITKHTMEAKQSKFSGDFEEQIIGAEIASLDLVLVAPRHLFRAPYSLHEKTALASIVLEKEQVKNFNPKDANPLNIKIKSFYPDAREGEATQLLESAIDWKKIQEEKQEIEIKAQYKKYDKISVQGAKDIPQEFFPKPIKKLLKGLKDGRKRGLFVLLTFLRTLNFSPEYINNKIREWNKLNQPPLKEGYIKAQMDWHLKQKKQILPPNYKNNNFYKDLNLFENNKMPVAKNPISEVLRKVRQNS